MPFQRVWQHSNEDTSTNSPQVPEHQIIQNARGSTETILLGLLETMSVEVMHLQTEQLCNKAMPLTASVLLDGRT
eukprot:3251135-Amphidinium_carterae.1